MCMCTKKMLVFSEVFLVEQLFEGGISVQYFRDCFCLSCQGLNDVGDSCGRERVLLGRTKGWVSRAAAWSTNL